MMNKLFKNFLIAGAGLTLAAAVSTASAAVSVITMNPDGVGGDGAVGVKNLSWATGNGLSVDSIGKGIGDTTQFYYQSVLGAFQDSGGTPIGGLNLNGASAATNYEWTIVVGANEKIIAQTFVPGVLGLNVFTLAPGGDNFVKIYYDPTPDANALAGTGFGGGGDAKLILDASIIELTSFFSVDFTKGATPLDGSGSNDYLGTSTVQGVGVTDASAQVNFADSEFFNIPVNSVLSLSFLEAAGLRTPFQGVDPSALFVDGSGATVTPDIGTVNGLNGDDFQFQVNANQTFQLDNRGIPEPATATLGLLSLAGLAAGALRRRNA